MNSMKQDLFPRTFNSVSLGIPTLIYQRKKFHHQKFTCGQRNFWVHSIKFNYINKKQTLDWGLHITKLFLLNFLSLLFPSSTQERGLVGKQWSHKRPVDERECKAMDSVLFCCHDFPCNGLFIWNMTPHCWHADSSRQVSKTLIRRRVKDWSIKEGLIMTK